MTAFLSHDKQVSQGVLGTVYLIHFERPYQHARHYLGWCLHFELETRIARHRASTGARLLQVINEVGIDWSVVRTWPEVDRHFERRLKNRGGARRICPACRPELVLSS